MMRKLHFMFLFSVVLLFLVKNVKAEEIRDDLGFVIEEISREDISVETRHELISPYTLYIMNAITHISENGDGKIHMGVEVYCTDEMRRITTTFYLQQLIDGLWVEVCEATGYVENSEFMIKFFSVSYPPSGNYRVRTINMVEDYNGYAEAIEGYSGDIYFESTHT